MGLILRSGGDGNLDSRSDEAAGSLAVGVSVSAVGGRSLGWDVQVVAVFWLFSLELVKDKLDSGDLNSDSVNSVVARAWRSWNVFPDDGSARRSWDRRRDGGLGPGGSRSCGSGSGGGQSRGSGESESAGLTGRSGA